MFNPVRSLALVGVCVAIAVPAPAQRATATDRQQVLDTMKRATVDRFARFFVMPQTGHGLSGTSYTTDGTGKTITPAPIPNRFDQTALLFDWVERGTAPPMSVVVTAGERSLPLCSYPSYPRYTSGPTEAAASYRCAQ